ncbi:MAG: FtsQ-type POTRA domain-containing protein [Tissierellia bacterium]|nr:FtsQ-type POTRA domain-containing protein [Tissierellia bacterium]
MKKRQKKLQRKYLFRRGLAVFLALILLMGGGYFFFRIKEVEVQGLDSLDEKTILDTAGIDQGRTYLSLNKSGLEAKLEKLSRVEKAEISFRPLNRLVIKIQEEEGLAQIYAKGEYYILNSEMVPIEVSKQYKTDLLTIEGIGPSRIKLGLSPFSKEEADLKGTFFKTLLESSLVHDLKSAKLLEKGLLLNSKEDLEIWVYSYKDPAYKIAQLEEILKIVHKGDETISTIILDKGDHPIAIKGDGEDPKAVSQEEEKKEDPDPTQEEKKKL